MPADLRALRKKIDAKLKERREHRLLRAVQSAAQWRGRVRAGRRARMVRDSLSALATGSRTPGVDGASLREGGVRSRPRHSRQLVPMATRGGHQPRPGLVSARRRSPMGLSSPPSGARRADVFANRSSSAPTSGRSNTDTPPFSSLRRSCAWQRPSMERRIRCRARPAEPRASRSRDLSTICSASR